jgi:hypothetical protein
MSGERCVHDAQCWRTVPHEAGECLRRWVVTFGHGCRLDLSASCEADAVERAGRHMGGEHEGPWLVETIGAYSLRQARKAQADYEALGVVVVGCVTS